MAALPTRIRQNLRDHITSPTSPLSLKTTSLQTNLGYPITLDPEWTMLWKTLQVFYPDPSTFVPYVAKVLITWCDAFGTWLETEENEEVVEKLLDELKGKGRVELVLEISPASSNRPTTAWRAGKSIFVVALPKSEPVQPHTILAGFSSDLLSLFTASPPLLPTSASTKAPAPSDDPEAWADLTLDSPETHPIHTPSSRYGAAIQRDVGEDFLPEVSTIQRPEELLKKPPYWLVVRQEGRLKVVVQGSHAPSLGVLEGYLKRWCRGEVGLVNRPPVVEIRLQESAFGLGLLNDTLTLEAIRGREISAMLVLAFVENVLGYSPVAGSGAAGCVWEFKRTKGFK